MKSFPAKYALLLVALSLFLSACGASVSSPPVSVVEHIVVTATPLIVTENVVVEYIVVTATPSDDYIQTESGKAMWVCQNPYIYAGFLADKEKEMPTPEQCTPENVRSDGLPHPEVEYVRPDLDPARLSKYPKHCEDILVDGLRLNRGEWACYQGQNDEGEVAVLCYDFPSGWGDKTLEMLRFEDERLSVDDSACH